MALFRERVDLAGCAAQVPLRTFLPVLTLEKLLTGVDNIRHDVFLSPKFIPLAGTHIGRLIAQYGDVQDLCEEKEKAAVRPPPVLTAASRPPARAQSVEFKDALLDLLTAALNRAKTDDNLSLETLCRLATIKFLRAEMQSQFAAALERCRAQLKACEGPRQSNPQRIIELRERTARFQMARKTILRKVGDDLFATLRELEKTALARMRRSLFGSAGEDQELFLNRLLFTEDGRDDFLNAEHYVMLGNYERDPDRFAPIREIAASFLRSLGYAGENHDAELDGLLSEPENAHRLFGGADPEAPLPKAVLTAWMERLLQEDVLAHVLAAYETAPLLAEYSPPVNPQQLKQALIFREEFKRVETLLEQHGKMSSANLGAAARRVERRKTAECEKMAARFLHDFMRYHRDLRRLEAVNSGLDSVNLIATDKLRELSAINHTLYEFLLAEEQKPAEPKILHHVILKADIRDSTQMTRTLFERGLNPASYFSLNFYEPVNKLLPKYGAQKLFLEGDAMILALFEHEGEPELGVGRACVLAKEIIEIVRAYNEQSQKAGLPILELGIGIAYQDTAPMYLMDGATPVMISPALNASDRLSSCSKSARRFCAGVETVFNVFTFQTIDDTDAAGQPEEFLIRYNIGGIVVDEPAFQKLQQEISLARHDLRLPTLWAENSVRIYTGSVPVASGIVHKLAVREARVPHIDAREFALKNWTGRRYYEVCTNPAVYEVLEGSGKIE
jgi:hypothetical protein